MRFKEYIGKSLTVYHGTKSPIERFDPSRQLSGYYPGFYTTSDEGRARTVHGQVVYSFEIDPERFFPIDRANEDRVKAEAGRAGFRTSQGSGWGEVQYLKSQGYAGIRRGTEYIVFEPDKTLKLGRPIDAGERDSGNEI